jgi:hypothetical protein
LMRHAVNLIASFFAFFFFLLFDMLFLFVHIFPASPPSLFLFHTPYFLTLSFGQFIYSIVYIVLFLPPLHNITGW